MLRLVIQFAQYRDFLKREDGATAIEYGLIAAGIAVLIIGLFAAFGDAFTDLFGALVDGMAIPEVDGGAG